MHYQSMFILGRQPAIGRVELESVFGSEKLQPIGEQAVACTLPFQDITFGRLGGSIRVAKLLTELDTVKWPEITRHLVTTLPEHLKYVPEGKLKLGLSIFGLPTNPRELLATGLELKKICKKAGRSVRIVPNSELGLSSAQVLHNHLTGELGMELLLIGAGQKTFLAQTKAVQDINAYAARDQGRPRRDARVGMLPPKLAQIIANLAAGSIPPKPDEYILDPFCGTGVVLQEALLMGYGAYGSDIEPRMVDFTQQNLEWLSESHELPVPILEVGDATNHIWNESFSAVAGEAYLGRPLSAWPDAHTLEEIISTCDVIIEKFLANLAKQVPTGLRLCLAVPAWRAPNGHLHHLRLLDHLEKMGYNRVSFEHAKTQDLVYYRPDQIVARQLLVITRK